jgi:hypothetical protein
MPVKTGIQKWPVESAPPNAAFRVALAGGNLPEMTILFSEHFVWRTKLSN